MVDCASHNRLQGKFCALVALGDPVGPPVVECFVVDKNVLPNRKARGSGSAAVEDPLDSYFKAGSPDRSETKAPGQKNDDPMADFFTERPKVKDLQDADEAVRVRRNKERASPPPKERQDRQDRRDRQRPGARLEDAKPRAREPRRSSGGGRSRSRKARRAERPAGEKARGDRGDRGDRSGKERKGERKPAARSEGGGRGGASLEDFIREHGLNDDVAASLRKLDRRDADKIMEGTLASARNPNGVVVSRINKLRDARKSDRSAPNAGRGRGDGERSQRAELSQRGDRQQRGDRRERTRGPTLRAVPNGSSSSRRHERPARAEQNGSTSGRSRRAEVEDDRRTRRRR